MKKYYYLLATFLIAGSISAQVGINTENPKATLQIQKKDDLSFPDGLILPRISGDSLRMKDAAYGADQNGVLLYVTSPTTNNSMKTLNVTKPGLYMYDGYFTHANSTQGTWMQMEQPEQSNASDMYAMKAAGNLTLLNLGINLLGSNVRTLTIGNVSNSLYNIEIPSTQVNNGSYIVPSDGVYHINYSYRTGQGVRAEILSGTRPGLIITKTVGASTTALDSRLFGGVQLLDVGIFGLANISITQGQISHIYNLKAGDELKFGIVEGGLSLGILTDVSAELSIFKIR